MRYFTEGYLKQFESYLTFFSIGWSPTNEIGNGEIQAKPWIFRVKEKIEFIQYGPELNEPRVDFACGLFNSDKHNGRPVIVVAGYAFDHNNFLKTSEYWDFTSSGSKWEFCSKYSFKYFSC